MDYKAFDRGAVQYLVGAIVNGVQFYLTDDLLASDIQDRARRFRSYNEADSYAFAQRGDPAWGSRFAWTAVRRIMGGAILI